jgi:hypothetical protein
VFHASIEIHLMSAFANADLSMNCTFGGITIDRSDEDEWLCCGFHSFSQRIISWMRLLLPWECDSFGPDGDILERPLFPVNSVLLLMLAHDGPASLIDFAANDPEWFPVSRRFASSFPMNGSHRQTFLRVRWSDPYPDKRLKQHINRVSQKVAVRSAASHQFAVPVGRFGVHQNCVQNSHSQNHGLNSRGFRTRIEADRLPWQSALIFGSPSLDVLRVSGSSSV